MDEVLFRCLPQTGWANQDNVSGPTTSPNVQPHKLPVLDNYYHYRGRFHFFSVKYCGLEGDNAKRHILGSLRKEIEGFTQETDLKTFKENVNKRAELISDPIVKQLQCHLTSKSK